MPTKGKEVHHVVHHPADPAGEARVAPGGREEPRPGAREGAAIVPAPAGSDRRPRGPDGRAGRARQRPQALDDLGRRSLHRDEDAARRGRASHREAPRDHQRPRGRDPRPQAPARGHEPRHGLRRGLEGADRRSAEQAPEEDRHGPGAEAAPEEPRAEVPSEEAEEVGGREGGRSEGRGAGQEGIEGCQG